MKFTIDKATAQQVLQKAYGITGKKSNIPILSHVLVETSERGKVVFSATDLDLSFRIEVEAEIEEDGRTTIPAKKLLDILREIPQSLISFELTEDDRMTVKAGRATFKLAIISADQFPYFNFPTQLDCISCSASTLSKAILKTLHVIPLEDDPFSIAGLFWQPVGSENLRLVASDGHRLVYQQIPVPNLDKLGIGNGVTVPRKGIQELAKILDKKDEIAIALDESRLIFRSENLYFSTQLLQEEFPNYDAIIPDKRSNSLIADREEFYLALRRMAVLTDQKWKHVKLKIHDNVLELSTGNPELWQGQDILDIEQDGDDLEIAFNIKYLLDTIQVMESEKIRFEWVDRFHGGIFLEPEDPGYFALIMPIIV